MEILIWIIAAYGFTNIMVYGSIFEGVRERIKRWGENPFNPLEGFFKFISGILSCMMCCSTWVGFFLGFLVYSPFHQFLKVDTTVSWFFDGLLASGGVWAINSIIEWYEENRPTNK
jgi:hypothetical protein